MKRKKKRKKTQVENVENVKTKCHVTGLDKHGLGKRIKLLILYNSYNR